MNHVPVLLFAKTPQIGAVNTRLIPTLGAEGAARLHTQMLRWKAGELAARYPNVQLWVTPTGDHPVIRELVNEHGLRVRLQSGRNLGERMGKALDSALGEAPAAVLLGTDCPPLPGGAVDDAQERLDAVDAVISPAEDGGFGLIGLRRYEPALFESVPWGSGEVMTAVRQRMQEMAWRGHELSACWDVDRPVDLRRLYHYPHTPAAIRALLEAHAPAVLQ